MHEYPKFTLLAFDVLIDYMPIFENKFCSIYDEIQKILPKPDEALPSTNSKMKKQYRLNDMSTQPREELLEFFTTGYESLLKKGSDEISKKSLGPDDSG